MLTDPEQLAAEHRAYRAIVGRDYGVRRDRWAEAVPELGAAWEKIKEKYGYEDRAEPDPQADGQEPDAQADGGAWHGKGGRRLDAAQNEEIDRGYARIREVGERTVVPGILSVEGEDPTRRLAGFDKRFKGEDRLKEKVADLLRRRRNDATEALAVVPDAVRFTYLYSETGYTAGMRNDVERLEARGFSSDRAANTWTS